MHIKLSDALDLTTSILGNIQKIEAIAPPTMAGVDKKALLLGMLEAAIPVALPGVTVAEIDAVGSLIDAGVALAKKHGLIKSASVFNDKAPITTTAAGQPAK